MAGFIIETMQYRDGWGFYAWRPNGAKPEGSPSFRVIYADWPIHRRWRRYIAPYGSPARIETQPE